MLVPHHLRHPHSTSKCLAGVLAIPLRVQLPAKANTGVGAASAGSVAWVHATQVGNLHEFLAPLWMLQAFGSKQVYGRALSICVLFSCLSNKMKTKT